MDQSYGSDLTGNICRYARLVLRRRASVPVKSYSVRYVRLNIALLVSLQRELSSFAERVE